jgi:membrane protease YdiL (CAAX protease family)
MWNIQPILDVIRTNPSGTRFSGLTGASIAVLVGVSGTFVAGLALLWIRLFANSILASVIVHVGTNSTVILAAIVVVHLA